MSVMKNFRKLNQIEILVLTFFIAFAVIKTECIAKKDDAHKFSISVEFIVPSTLTVNSQTQEIVILNKRDSIITYYDYGDPSKKIKNLIVNDIKLKERKSIKVEGYLIEMRDLMINLLPTKKIDEIKLTQFGVYKENHELGETLNIPIFQIKNIKVWRKGKAGKGMLIGAGCGVGVAALVAATGEESQDGANEHHGLL